MGATGHGIYRKTRKNDLDLLTFGIANAVVFKGKPPEGSGIDKPAKNKVTLKVPTDGRNSVLFQFKLSKNNKYMTITGYRDGIPEVKVTVDVDSKHPSLNSPKKGEMRAALKMKQLMNESSDVSENQLGSIAQELLRKKIIRRGE